MTRSVSQFRLRILIFVQICSSHGLNLVHDSIRSLIRPESFILSFTLKTHTVNEFGNWSQKQHTMNETVDDRMNEGHYICIHKIFLISVVKYSWLLANLWTLKVSWL